MTDHERESTPDPIGHGGCAVDDESGFSLVEVVVAIAILATSLAVLLNMISSSTRRLSQAQHLAYATLLAQSLLAKVGTEQPLVVGRASGEFADGYRWRTRSEISATDQSTGAAMRSYDVSVEVLWNDGPEERSATLNTVRLAPLGRPQ